MSNFKLSRELILVIVIKSNSLVFKFYLLKFAMTVFTFSKGCLLSVWEIWNSDSSKHTLSSEIYQWIDSLLQTLGRCIIFIKISYKSKILLRDSTCDITCLLFLRPKACQMYNIDGRTLSILGNSSRWILTFQQNF